MTYIDYFLIEYHRLIKDEYEKRKENLALGNAQDFNQYNRNVGFISGLKMALDLAEEAKTMADRATTGR